MTVILLRTDDGRVIALPRKEALWVLSSADVLDSVIWWHTASGANQQPQPFLMSRNRYLLALPRMQ